MMRVVIDTNVLISATFWTGSPKRLLNHVRQGRIVFLTSDFIETGKLKEPFLKAPLMLYINPC